MTTQLQKQTQTTDVEKQLFDHCNGIGDTTDDPLSAGVELAGIMERALLFGIIDVNYAWNMCEYISTKHSPLFDNHIDLMQYVGVPTTTMGRFRCFLRLILVENQFLVYWKLLRKHDRYLRFVLFLLEFYFVV